MAHPKSQKQLIPLEDDQARRAYVSQTDVPRHALSEAVRIPAAIAENFAKQPTKPMHVAGALEMSPTSGTFRTLTGAAVAFGLTTGGYNATSIGLTELGKRVVAPTSEGDDRVALREALLKPRIIREFLTKYNNNKLPNEQIARNVLEDLGVAHDASERILKILLASADEVGIIKTISGNRFVDFDEVAVSKTSQPDNLVTQVSPLNGDPKDDLPSEPRNPIAPKTDRSINRVFITHGRNKEIVNQLKELLRFGQFEPVVAADHETLSKPVPKKVMDEMRTCDAAIIHVGTEQELLDKEGQVHKSLNQNVLIEIGAAMMGYGEKFILLVEEGVSLPSNLKGLYEVRYTGDKLDYDATLKLLKAFNEFRQGQK